MANAQAQVSGPAYTVSIEAQMRAHAAQVRYRLRNARPKAPEPLPEPETPSFKNSGFVFVETANRPYSSRWREIMANTSARYGVSEQELLGPQRTKEIVHARAEAM